MTENITTGLILVIAAIHLLPIVGVLSRRRLIALYDVAIDSPDLEILMRHRAMLFGILGAFLAYAAFRPELQPLAFIAAFLSIVSFFYLAWSAGPFGPAIKKVVVADIVAGICLVAAAALFFSR